MIALLLAALVAQVPDPALNAPSHPEAPRISKLKWSPAVDLPVTGALGVGWLVSEFAVKKQLAPTQCRLCGNNGLDDSFRTLFAPNVGPSGGSVADDASNVVWISSAVLTLGLQNFLATRDGAIRNVPVDVLLVFEAVFAAMAINQLVKFAAARERPFVAQLRPEDKPFTRSPADNNLSFYSGHATFTMSLAVATGTITYLRGYRLGWIIWAVGIPLSLAAGVLRIAADKHNFTDLLVGWLAGAGIGFGVPWLFHNVENPLALRLVPGPGGIALAGRF